MKKNKILYLSNSLFPSTYANSVHVMKMCQAFVSNDYDIELVCYTQDKEFNAFDELNKYGIRDFFKINPLYVKSLRGKFFQKIFSVIHILYKENKNTVIYGRDVYSVYLASLLGYKVFYESHGLSFGLYGYVEKLLFKNKNLNKVVVISEKLKELYLKQHPFMNDTIKVLHDGADIVSLPKKETKNKKIKVGYIGSLYYKGRGIDIIIETAKKNLDLDFCLVGGNDKEVEFWKNKSSENISFIGHVPHNKVYQYLNEFDIVLMPYQLNLELQDSQVNTISWMSPMKMFEYMSAKKAIISSDLPVIREVLHKDNSILVQADDIDKWSRSVSLLAQDEKLRIKIAKNAEEEFFKFYTWNNRAKTIISWIK